MIEEQAILLDEWAQIKNVLARKKNMPYFKEGEVWWCHVGYNLGVEVYGKGKRYVRPVLIIRKFGRSHFLGIPLSSRAKNGPWYQSFDFKNKKQTALLSQSRTFSVLRLADRMGQVPQNDLELVKESFQKLIFKNTPPCQ